MSLVGTAALPLGAGWTDVQSKVTVSESGQFASTGVASSFFDVFFDISIADIDQAKDFGVASPIQIPASTTPVRMTLGADGRYHGDLGITRSLGASIGGDPSALDVLKLRAFSVAFTGPTGSGPYTYGTLMSISGGVDDASADPPFTIGEGGLTGPTTASSGLLGTVPEVPEPSSLLLLATGALLLRRRVRGL